MKAQPRKRTRIIIEVSPEQKERWDRLCGSASTLPQWIRHCVDLYCDRVEARFGRRKFDFNAAIADLLKPLPKRRKTG